MSLAPVAQVVIPDFGGSAHSCVRENHGICWGWIRDNWSSVLWPALRQHIVLTVIAVGVGFVIAVALALLAHRYHPLEQPVTIVTGVIYTIPSLALFQILVGISWLGLSRLSVEIALVGYTLLILFRNTLTGLRGVPEEVREAAQGMGLTRRQVLWRVEFPLAVPAIIAGLRIATVTIVSLATIAAFFINEGLGAPIFAAIDNEFFKTELYTAAAMAVGLAIIADLGLLAVQRALTPWSRRAR
jgi:osmoprotectant transport system permease protein